MLTGGSNSATYACRFPCQPPPIPKMMGGIFIPVTTEEMCQHWESYIPQLLLILYNGHSHFDSTANKIGQIQKSLLYIQLVLGGNALYYFGMVFLKIPRYK